MQKHRYSKIIFLPVLVFGFFSIAFFANAAVSFVACGTAVKVSDGSMTSVGIPAGIQNDDILVTYVHSRDNANSSMPADWTNKLQGDGNPANHLEIFWKRTSGLESPPTVTHSRAVSGGGPAIARMCAFRGVDTAGDPFNAAGSVQNNAGSPISTAAIVTTVTNAMILHVFGSSDDNAWGSLTGTPATFAAQDANTLGSDNSSGLAYGVLAAAGSSGVAGATQTALGPDAGVSVQMALRPSDTNAPAATFDLAVSNPTASSLRLDWTAPGDDGITGTATSYDIRYSTALITAVNFLSATQVAGEPAPLAAGSLQSMIVSGLNPNTAYYFALKTSDEVPNISSLSNVPSGTTLPPPSPTFPTPLTANPASVVSGGPSTLTWASSGADSCAASAIPANAQWTANGGALSGSQTITNLTVDTTFTLTCTNLGGSTPSSATVTVTPPPNVSGHAWAGSGVGANDAEINANPGIGWLKMSGTAGDGSSYGVLVSSASPGVLSGHAWFNPNDALAGINNIGWISFNAADVSGCPTAPCAPTLNRTTGAVTGWARACSVFQSGCSGDYYHGTGPVDNNLVTNPYLGGWDGWIRLWRDSDGDSIVNTDTGAAASDYGVSVSNCAWSGYGWGGGTNIGWVHFGGALYPMTGSGDACASVTPQCFDGADNDGDGLIDLADPGCINGSDNDEAGPIAPSGISADAGNMLATCNAILISWTDNSTDEDRFELERKLSSELDTAYVEIAEPSAAPGSGTVQIFTDTGAVGGLLRDTNYTYRIRACNAGGCSVYSNADVALNQNPLAQFTWAPPSPFKNANTTFNASASMVYGGASISEYSWTFTDGNPATFCSSVPGGCNSPLISVASSRFQFPPAPVQKAVTLRVTDSASRQCSVTQAVPVRSGSTPPGWEEIPPE